MPFNSNRLYSIIDHYFNIKIYHFIRICNICCIIPLLPIRKIFKIISTITYNNRIELPGIAKINMKGFSRFIVSLYFLLLNYYYLYCYFYYYYYFID